MQKWYTVSECHKLTAYQESLLILCWKGSWKSSSKQQLISLVSCDTLAKLLTPIILDVKREKNLRSHCLLFQDYIVLSTKLSSYLFSWYFPFSLFRASNPSTWSPSDWQYMSKGFTLLSYFSNLNIAYMNCFYLYICTYFEHLVT